LCCVCISSYTRVLHDLSGVLFAKMDIDLRGVQIRMSQPLLQLIRRNSFLGLTGCKRMPEGMAGGLLCYPCLFALLDDPFSYPPLRDRLTLVIEKDFLRETLTSYPQIAFEGVDSFFLKENLPLDTPLSPDGD